jgi:hypothetical protein
VRECRFRLASHTNAMTRRCPSTATWAAAFLTIAVLAATRSAGADDGWWSSPRSAAAAVAYVGAFLSCSAPSTCSSSTGRARVLGVLLASPRAHASTDDALTHMPPPETGAAAPKAAQEDAATYRDEFELMQEGAADAEMNREREKKAAPGHPVRRSLGTYAFDSEVCSYLEVSGTDESDGTYERMTSYCDGEPYYFCNDCSSTLYIWYEPSTPAWVIGDDGCGSTYADSWATYARRGQQDSLRLYCRRSTEPEHLRPVSRRADLSRIYCEIPPDVGPKQSQAPSHNRQAGASALPPQRLF